MIERRNVLGDIELDLLAAACVLDCSFAEACEHWRDNAHGWTAADFRTACAMGWTPSGGWPPALREEV